MEIAEIEIHEYENTIEDHGTREDGAGCYVPGAERTEAMFILTIRTRDGTEGQYRGVMFPNVQLAQIRMWAEELIGRDPLAREDIWMDFWRRGRHTDRIGIGPIDVALWDLAGQHYGAPLYELLGGGKRDRIPAYASTLPGNPEHDTPEVFADHAEACAERGYPGYKLHPLGDPDLDIAVCRAVDERVGDELDLMLDPSSTYTTYRDALRVGRVLDDLDFYWYEDPMWETGESVYAMRRLADDIDTPLLGIEHSRTEPFGSINHLFDDALDMLRVDAHLGGGITGALKTAHAAQAAGFDVEPHLGGAAHLHLLSAVPNSNYYEHGLLHPHTEWHSEAGLAEPVDEIDDDGHVPVPDGDGLGIEIDWDFVEANETDRTLVD
ncbi:enolase C-terminal domain-like protein [Halosimplex sp. TS25]|uniref:enolase C-terminal domain-like protein n=1 Tax=Halosimplex rarum TaxID=3396619 RepID=UPI0039E9BF8C